MSAMYPLIVFLMICGITSLIYWAYAETSDSYLFIGLFAVGLGCLGIALMFYDALFIGDEKGI